MKKLIQKKLNIKEKIRQVFVWMEIYAATWTSKGGQMYLV